MNTNIPSETGFVKKMLLSQFTTPLSQPKLVDSLKVVARKTLKIEENETITLIVFASKTKSSLKVNGTNYTQEPFIRDDLPIDHTKILNAFETQSNTLLPDLLEDNPSLLDSLALRLPVWAMEYERCKLKDQVGLGSITQYPTQAL